MKLKINNSGYHFNYYNLLFEGIHRYNTKNTSIVTYFDSVVLLLEINPKEIFQKKEKVAYTSDRFVILTGEKETTCIPNSR